MTGRSFELDDRLGNTFDFNALGIEVTEADGVGMPPVFHKQQATAFSPGALFRGVKVQPRIVTLHQIIHETTFAEYLQKRLTLAEIFKFDQVADDTVPFVLRFTGGAIILELEMQYDSGFEQAGRLPAEEIFAVRMIAYDPFWCETSDDFQFLVVGGNTTVLNKGTASAYPILTLTGPGTLTQIKNNTSGDELNFDDLDLDTDEVLVIDLSIFVKTFELDDDNVIGSVDTGSAVADWRLLPGENDIFINAGAAAIARIDWTPCHWSLDAAENILVPGDVELAATPLGAGVVVAGISGTITTPLAAQADGQATVTPTLTSSA